MKMKVSQAAALLVALGFPKAKQWDQKTLQERIAQVPDKFKEEEIPENFKDVYRELAEVKGSVTLIPNVPVEEVIDVSTMSQTALRSLISERELSIKGVVGKSLEALRAEVKKALKAVSKKDAKATLKKDKSLEDSAPNAPQESKEEKKKIKVKKEKVVMDEGPRDDYGMKPDSQRGLVNATFSNEWKSEQDVVDETKLTLKQIQHRLCDAARQGILERRHLIQFRLIPKS